MDAYDHRSNHKHQHENDDDNLHESKRQRPATPVDEPISIFDLDDDCLANSFERLDLRSLFNVAVANEWLRSAACDVYRRRFGMKKVCMNINDHFYSLTCGPYEGGDEIKVHGFKKCLQFVRCLGSSIGSLGIWYKGWTNKQCQHIDEYINQYCADSLVRIEFVGKPNISVRCFEKPFVNVQKLDIFDCDLDNQLPSFPRCFPNTRALELNNVHIDERYVETPFRNLHELRIDINKDGLRRFKNKEVANLLRKCPQLECLHIRVYDRQGLTFNTLFNFIDDNTTIRNLHVNMIACSMIEKPSEVRKLIQHRPELIKLDFTGFKIPVEIVVKLIQQLNALKWFRLQLDKKSDYGILVNRLANGPWQASMHIDRYWNRQVITLER